jgi:hypothetical protein
MEYFLKFSAILGLFFIFYKLFLEKETFFNSIRIYFILGIVSALTLPFVIIPEYVTVERVFVEQTMATLTETGNADNSLDLSLTSILIGVYSLGVLFFGFRFLTQLGSLLRFILQYPKNKQHGFIFIEAEESTSPFSFFNYIIYPKKRFNQKELNHILEHEKVHASQHHSIDILLSQLLIIFNWFNPLAWLYYREIQKNLEFIADQGAQKDMDASASYQYLLLKTTTPNYSLALTSNFYNSLIKKRIKMLHQNKSSKMMYFKFMFIIPALILFVFTFNTKVIAQQKKVEKIEIHQDLEMEVITKEFQKSDLEKLKASLMKKGITVQYKKLKYNDNNEITGIHITVENKQGNKAQIHQSGTDPIKPISIKFNNEGDLAVGNMESMDDHNIFFTSGGDKVHKKVIVTSNGDHSKKDSNSYVFISEDGDETHVKVVNGKKVTEEIHGPHGENVWVSESGDSTKLKKIKIIEIDEDSDGEKTVIVKKIRKDGEETKVNVEVIEGDHEKGNNKMMFISEGDEQPLMIVDGKEVEGGSLEDINPDDIETVNVYKGDKAIEKYGDKAKNGVVVIKTKK